MPKQLVTRAELARRAGVSRPAATKACNGPLADAWDGKRVDLAHPTVVAYLEKQGNAPTPGAVKVKSRSKVGGAADKEKRQTAALERHVVTLPTSDQAPQPADDELDQKFAAYFDYTVRDIVRKFGTDTAFADFLKAAKAIEDIKEKQLKNDEKKGQLVSRELMRRGVFDVINETHRRMLTDGAKSISNDLEPMVRAGISPLEREAAIAERLGKFINPCKARMARALKNA